MAHNHGNEYQIRIVREDGIEELSGWMNSTEQVAQAMLAVHRPQGKTYWLLVRNILCPNCSDREQIMEYPHNECPVSTIHPTRLPLSAGSGVEEPVHFGLFSITRRSYPILAHEAFLPVSHRTALPSDPITTPMLSCMERK